MPQFKVSGKANKDLFEIGLYTQNKFGVKQRDKYLDIIAEKFVLLANQPELGTQRFNIRAGYYSLITHKHIIFYRKFNYGIRIIRILHQSMDRQLHL